MHFNRRTLLRRLGKGGLCTALAGLGGFGYGRAVEPGWLDVVRQDVVLPRLPEAFAGFTIAQLSDLHFGPYMRADDIAPAVRAALRPAPEAIVLTGDFVSQLDHGEADMIVQALAPLRAPQGVYAVLGNHDVWENADVVSAALRRAGVTLLSNEHVSWRRDGAMLYLAGVDDVWTARHDLEAALAGLGDEAAVVLLAHEPDFADEVSFDRRVLLQLSGHSHGGQVCLPFYGGLHFPPLGQKYPVGLRRVRELTLYTNRGLGMVGVPLRFCCRPEVTFFTLQNRAADERG